jgi:hypothetical protein
MPSYLRGFVAGVLGAVVTLALAVTESLPPTGAVAGGALVAAVAHWRTADRSVYRVTGTVYTVAAAASLVLWPAVTPVYRWSLVLSLVVFGLVSALVTAVFVIVRVGARAVARQFVPEAYAAALAEFASALASALAVVWTVIQLQERLVRTGVTGVVGTAALAVDWLGISLPVDVGLVGAAVETPVVVFVGSVVVGFHTLASWAAAWRVADESAASRPDSETASSEA